MKLSELSDRQILSLIAADSAARCKPGYVTGCGLKSAKADADVGDLSRDVLCSAATFVRNFAPSRFVPINSAFTHAWQADRDRVIEIGLQMLEQLRPGYIPELWPSSNQ